MKLKTVDDAMICPYCGHDDCYQYDTDETNFSYDGTGHYYIDCHCRTCDKNFRLYLRFRYTITEAYTYTGQRGNRNYKYIYKET